MRNTFKLIGIGLMVGGWLCAGLGFTTNIPHPINDITLVGGFIMIYIGVVILGVIVLRS